MSITNDLRGIKDTFVPSWITSCGPNPTINDILATIDEGAQPRISFTVGQQFYCDYVTDGVDDHVQIQQAWDDLIALGGGELILTSDLYNVNQTLEPKSTLSTPVTFSAPANGLATIKMGAGLNISVFSTSNVVENLTLQNIIIDQQGATQAFGGGMGFGGGFRFNKFENVEFLNSFNFNLFISTPAISTLTGTIDLTNGSDVVTGTGTLFLTELEKGDFFKTTNEYFGEVVEIISNTELRLSYEWQHPTDLGATVEKMMINELNVLNKVKFQGTTNIQDNVGLGLFNRSVIINSESNNSNGYGLGPDSCYDTRIINYSSKNCDNSGIGMETCSRLLLDNVSVRHSDGNGLYMLNGCRDIKMNNIDILNVGGTGISTGNVVAPSNYGINKNIKMNQVTVARSGGHGFRIDDAQEITITNPVSRNNSQDVGTFYGIALIATNETTNKVTIINPECFDDQDTPTQNGPVFIGSGVEDTHILLGVSRLEGNISDTISDSGTRTRLDYGNRLITVSLDGDGDFNCDGAADQIQINDALATISSIGDVVRVKGGEYDITANIVLPDGVNGGQLRGDGKNTIFKRNASFTTGRVLQNENTTTGNDDWILRDFTIDGNNGVVAHHDGGENLYIARSENVHVDNVYSYNACDEGLQMINCIDSGFNRCYSEGTGISAGFRKAGIIVSGLSLTLGNTGENCMITNCQTLNTAGEGVGSYQARGSIIANNTIRWTSGATNNCQIQLEQTDDVVCVGNNVYSNHYGIVVLSAERIAISGNTIYRADEHGIYVAGSSRDISITGNSLYTIDKHGVMIQDTGSHISVVGNKFVDVSQEGDNTYDAIHIDPNGGFIRRITITGNTAYAVAANKMRYFIATTTDVSNQILGLSVIGNGAQAYQTAFKNIDNELYVTQRNIHSNSGDSDLVGELMSIEPMTDNLYDLGTTSKYWRNAFIQDIRNRGRITWTPSNTVNDVSAGVGITSSMITKTFVRVQGNGGAVDITANPQIANGSNEGQFLILAGSSDTNRVTLNEGDGLNLNEGQTISLGLDDYIMLIYRNSEWHELTRSITQDYFPFTSGRYYGSQMLSDNGAGVALVADRIYLVPFKVDRQTTFVGMGFRCSTTDAGSVTRAGIYYDNGAGVPGDLIDQTSDIDTSTATGGLSAAFTGGNLTLNRGHYWLAVVSDGTPSIHFMSSSDNLRWLGFGNYNDVTGSVGVIEDIGFSGTGVLPSTITPTYTASAIPDVRIEVN